uniref:Putative 8.9 kDa family member n=1 Tax=Rhipicephalus pulchellus TaxID=72859 RepID=L7MCD5_RHIPC
MSASLSILLLLLSTCTAYVLDLGENCNYNGTTLPDDDVIYFNNTCEMGFCSFGYGFIYGCGAGQPIPYSSCIDKRQVGHYPKCCTWIRTC